MKHIYQPEKSGQFICYKTGQFYLLLKLVVGAQGGHAAGRAMPGKSLGIPGNTIAGVVGGGLGGQILNTMLGRLLRLLQMQPHGDRRHQSSRLRVVVSAETY
jgi:uncharacterized membrane protein YeaQ/YmgE (transglycosylase-associated protein family)